ncbi:MAG: response regulator transcription factor [Firmicutes bacterium]|nr:response regulator transcription factor [Bacillota bacterium]MBQ3123766.1 response regulator transcription factor [Bacillota bacterium]MBQ9972664.1 response regulator transcription factor [Bacillota bacterium]
MIFCVEDDAGIRNMMIYTLNSSGFEAEGFSDGNEFFDALEKNIPDLVILDIMLPGDDGLVILSKLRSQSATSDIPVIMATAKGTEFDKIIGLDMGADDYLAKPFGMMEMVSRVKAVLRRSKPKEKAKIVKVGRIEMNLNEHTVAVDDERLKLTLKEFEMLRLFMENLGRAFTREELLEYIWDSDYLGETRTVDVHVGTLRTKLGECGDYIETVRGVGYRMEARV